MLLRILASISIFLLVTGLIYFTTLMLFGSFTLYSTASDTWVDNLTSIGFLTSAILAAVLVSVSYFRKYSLTKLLYQPYANLAALILTAALTSQIEFGDKSTSAELIEITVLPEEFIIEGCSGIDIVAMLKELTPQDAADKKQIVIFAPGDVGYERVQNTLQRLHDTGYSNVGLMSDAPANKPCQYTATSDGTLLN